MSVEQRIIVGAEDQERVAVVTIPIPAGGEVEIDRTWRFAGWLVDRQYVGERGWVEIELPNRISVDEE